MPLSVKSCTMTNSIARFVFMFYAVTTRVAASARVQEPCGGLLAIRDNFLCHVRMATAKLEGRAGEFEICVHNCAFT